MKKIIIAAVCAAVILGGTFGAYKINESRKSKKAVAKVTPVSLMTDSYWGDQLELSGVITSGNVQKVMLDNQKLVDEVLVKEGDTVKKGDPLMKYDMTALELDAAQKENAVSMAEVNIKTAKKELTKLKNLKPSELMPTEPEPTDPPEPVIPEKPSVNRLATVENSSMAVTGDGSAQNPLVFICSAETVVKKAYLQTMMQNQTYSVFRVYDDSNTAIYQWTVFGGYIKETPTEDWCVGESVTLNNDGGISLEFNAKIYGSFKVLAEEAAEDIYYDNYEDSVYTGGHIDPNSDDYAYSRAEIAKMITEKESEIKSLELEKKSAELAFKTAQAQKESGSIISTMDGHVSSVGDLDNLEAGTPFIVVEGQSGLSVTGYVGEMNLDKVAVGSYINVMSWETGESAQAEVTEINMTPVSYSSQNWNENPNSSTYEFTAEITDDTSMSTDMGISITIPAQSEESGMFIPKVYVREEDGNYYVMKADENNRLKKQYVKTGRIIYGSQIEIKSGLSESDKICFPYGKNIKEGIKTKDSDEVLW